MKFRMNNLTKNLLLFFLAYSIAIGHAKQSEQNSQLKFGLAYQKAYRNVLQLQLQKVRSLLPSQIHHPEFILIEHYCYVIEALIVNSDDAIDNVKSAKKRLIKKVKALSISHSDKALLESEILLTTALVRLKNGDYFTAFQDIRSAYKLYESHLNDEHYLWRNQLVFRHAILQTLIGTIPDQYTWGIRLIGLEGDMEQGKKTLYSLMDKNTYGVLSQPEIIATIALLELHLFNNPEAAEQWATNQRLTLLESPLVLFLESVVYRRKAMNDLVIQKLKSYTPDRQALEFHYLYYMKGEALLRRLDPGSVPALKLYLQKYKGPHFKRASWQMIGWAGWVLHHDSTMYLTAMTEIKHTPESIMERDKSATRSAERLTLPAPELLKARLLFDGGYYLKAKEVLDNIQRDEGQTLDESIEISYRYGRIFQTSNQIFKAHESFNQVLAYKDISRSYMICQSAIQKAEMYEQSEQYANAAKYYDLALSLKPDEYKNGLHQKAKAGKLRVKRSLR